MPTDSGGGSDGGSDSGLDASEPMDAGLDASEPLDAGLDAATPPDGGADASAPLDAGFDAFVPFDAGVDASAPFDAGFDAFVPFDAGLDGGADAGAGLCAPFTCMPPVPNPACEVPPATSCVEQVDIAGSGITTTTRTRCYDNGVIISEETGGSLTFPGVPREALRWDPAGRWCEHWSQDRTLGTSSIAWRSATGTGYSHFYDFNIDELTDPCFGVRHRIITGDEFTTCINPYLG
ncbi:MAG: hypothetical protein KC656_34035, partial [Myxococcales bacterium]|nr:hypothetical protein [Myxococcales bacterium]